MQIMTTLWANFPETNKTKMDRVYFLYNWIKKRLNIFSEAQCKSGFILSVLVNGPFLTQQQFKTINMIIKYGSIIWHNQSHHIHGHQKSI